MSLPCFFLDHSIGQTTPTFLTFGCKAQQVKRIQWFLGEFFVVVAGVLVAFMLNGWWNTARDEQQEDRYIAHLVQDLRKSLENVEKASVQQEENHKGAAMLLRMCYEREPPPDSVINHHLLKSLRISPAVEVSSTLVSLVNTGDIELIQNDSLRFVLAEFAAEIADYKTQNENIVIYWIVPAFERFIDELNFADRRYNLFDERTVNLLAEDSLRAMAVVDDRIELEFEPFELLLRKASFRRELTKLWVAHGNLHMMHQSYKARLEEVLNFIETTHRD